MDKRQFRLIRFLNDGVITFDDMDVNPDFRVRGYSNFLEKVLGEGVRLCAL